MILTGSVSIPAPPTGWEVSAWTIHADTNDDDGPYLRFLYFHNPNKDANGEIVFDEENMVFEWEIREGINNDILVKGFTPDLKTALRAAWAVIE